MYKIKPVAYGKILGGPLAPDINGHIYFYDAAGGTEIFVEVWGLPLYKPAHNGNAPIGPLGFHIHEYGVCEITNYNEPFQSAGGHYNPNNEPHGNHAGDLPVLFSNNGYARMTFYTDRFKPRDIIGKSIIIHEHPDDYRTQPAGNSGRRLACGVIAPYNG